MTRNTSFWVAITLASITLMNWPRAIGAAGPDAAKPTTQATTSPSAATDEKAIAGAWVIQSATDDGADQAGFKDAKFTFNHGKAIVEMGGDQTTGKYTLDSSADPKSIDLGIKIGDFLVTHKGLYTLKGDDLTICLTADMQGARPAKLDGSKGSKCWLWKLRRQP